MADILQCKHPLSTEHGTSSGCGQSSKCRVHLHGSCGVMDFSGLGTEIRSFWTRNSAQRHWLSLAHISWKILRGVTSLESFCTYLYCYLRMEISSFYPIPWTSGKDPCSRIKRCDSLNLYRWSPSYICINNLPCKATVRGKLVKVHSCEQNSCLLFNMGSEMV